MLTFGAERADASLVKRLPVLLAVTALAATSCQAAGAATAPPTAVVAVSSPQATLTLSPASGKRKVNPKTPVVVEPSDGQLSDVRVVDGSGHKLKGAVDSDGVWRSKPKLLKFATTYTVTAHAIDASGRKTLGQSVFRTLKPSATLTTSISPVAGSTVGVGMPVIVRLSAPVTKRRAVQSALTVTTSREVNGSWSWISDRELHWRPETYWPADTDVAIKVRLKGLQAGNGVWGTEDRTVRYHVGSDTISTVDIKEHTLTVTQGGKVVRTIPITTGKDGFRTRGGIKVITSKERYRVMDAATIDIQRNDPEYYRLKVEYAMRLTWSGEFLHAAPWSVANQGREDVSHGCTGMSLEDAAWLFGISKVGDVVIYTGSSRSLESGNGWTDWNVSWSDWTARSFD